jgi:uncharacterized protein YbjT (DUF2867 family)
MEGLVPGQGGLILLTGATGYIGGRLLRVLEDRKVRLRCLARRPEFLRRRVSESTEVVKGDLSDPESLQGALAGVDTAYYLVHSMGSGRDFAKEDRSAAENFARAARDAGVRRIVYLGGLGSGPGLSPHLASRQEVGRILRESGVPTIEFRASIIIGSGSLSFEMIRSLVDRLPVMITPRWVRIPAQPIAIEDVIAYLVEALDADVDGSAIVEIGGGDRVTYEGIMLEYARQRGLKRLMIRVPVLTPRLSSLWLGLVTPLYARIGRTLIDSIPHETVVTDDLAIRLFDVRPRGIRETIERALSNEDQEMAATRWSDALSSRGAQRAWGGTRFGSRLVDSRSVRVACSPPLAFRPISRIGGETGWYYANWLWRIRGFLDLLVGGAGLRRGRRDPTSLLPGDTVDFWRVEAYEPDRLLRLFAEMKVPGRAWLQFEVEEDGNASVVRQSSIFDPVGLLGLLYWYGLYPIHSLVFAGMLRGIARAVTREFDRGGEHVTP